MIHRAKMDMENERYQREPGLSTKVTLTRVGRGVVPGYVALMYF